PSLSPLFPYTTLFRSRGLGARRVLYDRLVGVAAYFETRAGVEADSFTLVEAVASGWWYSAHLPGRKLVAVYMTDGDLLEVDAARSEEHTSELQSRGHL